MAMNRTLGLLCGALLMLGNGVQTATPQPGLDRFFGDGGTSDFYRWQGPALRKPGVMLRQEPVGEGFYADNASLAHRILYSSTDGRFGRGVVEASGLLYLPKGSVPKGGWPLVVWGHGTFGIADICAPSWKKPTPRDGNYADAWLKAGFAVVAPDYQGLGTPGVHPYLQREAEGYSVLDAARAALAAYPGQISNRVILTGQSQGSGAVLNATAVWPGYASDVHLLGTVATALVWRAADAPEPDRDVMASDAARYAVMRLMSGGFRPGSPAPDAILSEKGKALAAAAATGCSRDLVPVLQREGIDGPNAFAVPPAKVAAMLGSVEIPRRKLDVPLLIATGRADALIPPSAQYAAVTAMCRVGNRVVWNSYAGVGHSGTSNYALKDAIPFARALLAGQKVQSNCSAINAPPPLEKMDPAIPFND
jgi:pimeloyl-ACP methyl ester carboxylesterase